jgi:5-methylcytosine-specific restriction protein A
MSPMAPMHPCGYPGCATLTDTARCELHRKKEQREYDQSRKDDPFRKLYSSARWKRIRDSHLMHEPLCRACKERGRLVEAKIVDHIIPIRRSGDPFDAANFQSLCTSCHSEKSIREGSRFG